MTYLTFEAREVTPAVIACPDLSARWKQAAEQGLIKAVGLGRYSAVLDSAFADELRRALPELTNYLYDDREGTVKLNA